MDTVNDKPIGLIHRKSGNQERLQRLGPYILESLVNPDEEGRATVYRVHLDANQQTPPSRHQIAEEFYFVIAGQGTAQIDGQSIALGPGDFLRLPPGTRHAFVTGEYPLDVLNFHVPGCRPDRDTYFDD